MVSFVIFLFSPFISLKLLVFKCPETDADHYPFFGGLECLDSRQVDVLNCFGP